MALDKAFFVTWEPRLLAVLRIVTAFLFIQHGTAKYFGIPMAMPEPVAVFSLIGLAGLLEIVGSALLILGLFTRPVAFILSGEMAFAYFMAHAPQGHVLSPILNHGESAVLFCFIFLYLAFAGAGSWSVDAARGKLL